MQKFTPTLYCSPAAACRVCKHHSKFLKQEMKYLINITLKYEKNVIELCNLYFKVLVAYYHVNRQLQQQRASSVVPALQEEE